MKKVGGLLILPDHQVNEDIEVHYTVALERQAETWVKRIETGGSLRAVSTEELFGLLVALGEMLFRTYWLGAPDETGVSLRLQASRFVARLGPFLRVEGRPRDELARCLRPALRRIRRALHRAQVSLRFGRKPYLDAELFNHDLLSPRDDLEFALRSLKDLGIDLPDRLRGEISALDGRLRGILPAAISRFAKLADPLGPIDLDAFPRGFWWREMIAKVTGSPYTE